jgi:murein DD-endopeptidase MepM/ murein hydrolase activator NlpD
MTMGGTAMRLLCRGAGAAALFLAVMLAGCAEPAPTTTSYTTRPSEGTGESGTPRPPAAVRNPGQSGPIPAEPDFVWPLRGEIVARFKESGSGVDIRATAGQMVVAAKSGRVNVFENAPEYGKVIVLEHEDGRATYYGRLGEILVTHGAWVKQGEAIATAGFSSGNGAELQFRVMENDQFVDPLRVLPR